MAGHVDWCVALFVAKCAAGFLGKGVFFAHQVAITVVKRNLSLLKGNCGKLNVQSLNACLAGDKGNKHFDVTT